MFIQLLKYLDFRFSSDIFGTQHKKLACGIMLHSNYTNSEPTFHAFKRILLNLMMTFAIQYFLPLKVWDSEKGISRGFLICTCCCSKIKWMEAISSVLAPEPFLRISSIAFCNETDQYWNEFRWKPRFNGLSRKHFRVIYFLSLCFWFKLWLEKT